MKLCSNGDEPSNSRSNKTEDDYLHQLECLNTSVAEWISQHVQRNPLVDLTPIFRDYEAYLNSLDQKRKQLKNENIAVTKDTKTLPIVTETVQSKEVIQSGNGDHVIPSITSATVVTTTGIITIVYHISYHGNI